MPMSNFQAMLSCRVFKLHPEHMLSSLDFVLSTVAYVKVLIRCQILANLNKLLKTWPKEVRRIGLTYLPLKVF